VIRAIELQLRFFQLQVMSKLGTIHLDPLNYFVIRVNSKLQHELQLRYDDVILLNTKLILGRLSPRHTLILKPYFGVIGNNQTAKQQVLKNGLLDCVLP
jgi:hypothetical protein